MLTALGRRPPWLSPLRRSQPESPGHLVLGAGTHLAGHSGKPGFPPFPGKRAQRPGEVSSPSPRCLHPGVLPGSLTPVPGAVSPLPTRACERQQPLAGNQRPQRQQAPREQRTQIGRRRRLGAAPPGAAEAAPAESEGACVGMCEREWVRVSICERTQAGPPGPGGRGARRRTHRSGTGVRAGKASPQRRKLCGRLSHPELGLSHRNWKGLQPL